MDIYACLYVFVCFCLHFCFWLRVSELCAFSGGANVFVFDRKTVLK